MSTGVMLKAAVRQRLSSVLEEVLVLIQNAVDQYDAQLQRSTISHETSDRLRRLNVRLRTETEDNESEKSHIKEEDPDVWSRDEPASGQRTILPQPTSNAHEQHHGNHPNNHKTESEDSDEECPICKQQSEQMFASSNINSKDHPINRTAMQDKGFENTHRIKTEVEDQGYGDSAHNPPQNLTNEDQSAPEEEAGRSRHDLKRAADHSDPETAPKVRKTQEETAEFQTTESEITESETADTSNPEHDLQTVNQQDTVTQSRNDEDLSQFSNYIAENSAENGQTSEVMELEDPNDKDMQLESPNLSLVQHSTHENDDAQALEAQTSTEHSRTQEIQSVTDVRNEKHDQAEGLEQNAVLKRPTVRLVHLKLAAKPQRNEKRSSKKPKNRKTALSLKRLSTGNAEKQSEGQDSANLGGVSEVRMEKSQSVGAKNAQSNKDQGANSVSQTSREDSAEEGSSVLPSRKRLNRKAKTKAQRERLRHTDSASDTDVYDDSDFKMEDASDSGDSDDEGYSRNRKARGRSERRSAKNSQLRLTRDANSENVDKSKDENHPQTEGAEVENVNSQNGKQISDQILSNGDNLDKNSHGIDQQKEADGAENVNLQSFAFASGNSVVISDQLPSKSVNSQNGASISDKLGSNTEANGGDLVKSSSAISEQNKGEGSAQSSLENIDINEDQSRLEAVDLQNATLTSDQLGSNEDANANVDKNGPVFTQQNNGVGLENVMNASTSKSVSGKRDRRLSKPGHLLKTYKNKRVNNQRSKVEAAKNNNQQNEALMSQKLQSNNENNLDQTSIASTSQKPDAMKDQRHSNKDTKNGDLDKNGRGVSEEAEVESARNSDPQNVPSSGEKLSSNDKIAAESGERTETRVKPKQQRRPGHYECAECGTVFSLKRNLLLHAAVHSDERPFKCDRCDATFKRKLNLKAHMSTHSQEKEFQCSICGKRFTRKSGLDDHMKSHTGEKPYSCSVCGRAFSCRSNLRRHSAAHSGLRPFQCEVCGKKFGRRAILVDHMTSHTGERSFGCSVCGTMFSRKHNLLKHSRIHRDERRFRCEECGARFSQKVHLEQHSRRHTGEKPFSCHICQKTFTRKGYVTQHLAMYCTGNKDEREKKQDAEGGANDTPAEP